MKKIVNYVIGIVFLVIVVLFLLWLNSISSECEKLDNYNESSGLCYYESTDCRENERYSKGNCYYSPSGFLSNPLLIVLFIIFGVALVGFLLFKDYFKFNNKVDNDEFDYGKRIDPKIAKELIIQSLLDELKIPHKIVDGKVISYDKSFVKINIKNQVFQKPNFEWFIHFEIELIKSESPGIYSIVCSLSRGKNWILNGNHNVLKCSFEDYKEKRTKPLYQSKDRSERHTEMLLQQGKVDEAKKMMYNSKMISDQEEKIMKNNALKIMKNEEHSGED